MIGKRNDLFLVRKLGVRIMLLTEIQAVSKFVGCVLEDPSQAGGYLPAQPHVAAEDVIKHGLMTLTWLSRFEGHVNLDAGVWSRCTGSYVKCPLLPAQENTIRKKTPPICPIGLHSALNLAQKSGPMKWLVINVYLSESIQDILNNAILWKSLLILEHHDWLLVISMTWQMN